MKRTLQDCSVTYLILTKVWAYLLAVSCCLYTQGNRNTNGVLCTCLRNNVIALLRNAVLTKVKISQYSSAFLEAKKKL
jgi:hypothetical protein